MYKGKRASGLPTRPLFVKYEGVASSLQRIYNDFCESLS